MTATNEMTQDDPTTMTQPAFLRGFEVYDVDQSGTAIAVTDCAEFSSIAQAIGHSGQPIIVTERDQLPFDVSAALAFPIYRDGKVVSIVVLIASSSPDAVGVFEVWEPVGFYDDVKLLKGYYSKLDRFQNVSTFVRFEKGIGLPGQVWHRHRAVIHTDLPHHPGFLRAAGASAGALAVGIGIPVFDDDFVASIVLLSAEKSPMARAFEVWLPDDDAFKLLEGFYANVGSEVALAPGATLRHGEGLAGLAATHGGACVSSDVSVCLAGRSVPAVDGAVHSGLAIPYFDGSTLTSIVVLLF